MKRLLSLLIMSIAGLTLIAQTNPNRLLVRETTGNVKGFLVENIDSIYFAKQEGRVAADVAFKEYRTGDTGDTLMLSVTRTEGCQAFRIAVLPTNRMTYLSTDALIASYLESNAPQLYWQDFENAQMTGFEFEFKDDTDYTIITTGYDQYGIGCAASRADFHTPKIPLVGNPQVAWTIDDVQAKQFTITFTPNADAVGYSFCLFGRGEAEAQFQQMGAMFGFANMGEMVRMWGLEHEGVYTHTYTGQTPGKEYDLLIQPWDVNGTNGEIITVPVTMKKLGGEGLAQVEIVIGEFVSDADGARQYVSFTPNDQTSLYHAMLIEKDTYNEAEWGEAGVLNYLKSEKDPYNPYNPYWDLFDTDNSSWTVNPGTTYMALAIAQNINGEWGPLASKEFTTPAASQAAPRKVKAAPSRRQHGTSAYTPISKLAEKAIKAGKIAGGVKLIAR